MFEYLENVNVEIDGIILEKGYDFYEFNSNSIENFCRKILFLVVQRNIFRIDARAIINNLLKKHQLVIFEIAATFSKDVSHVGCEVVSLGDVILVAVKLCLATRKSQL